MSYVGYVIHTFGMHNITTHRTNCRYGQISIAFLKQKFIVCYLIFISFGNYFYTKFSALPFLMKIFKLNTSVYGIFDWGGRIRTYACSSQSAVSYRLTTPQCELVFNSDKGFGRVFAKALFCGVEDGTRTHGLQCHNTP